MLCIATTGRIELVFLARRLLSTCLTLCYITNVGTFENKGTTVWNFVPNSGLKNRKFRHGKPIALSKLEGKYSLESTDPAKTKFAPLLNPYHT